MMKLKKQDSKKIIFLVIIIAVLLILLMVIACIINSINKKEQDILNQKKYTSITDFKTVDEVANYLECKLKKKEESTKENCKYDVYMTIKYAPYTDGLSNERYYEKLTTLLAQVLDYSNYRVIDKEKDLTVDVICDYSERKIKTVYINGESSYFSVNDSINKITNKKEESATKVNIQSKMLKELMANNLDSSKVSLGQVDSSFNGYKIYFDEGYEIKESNKIIFNVVFTEKYKEKVLSDLKTTSTKEEIVQKLGNPIFEDVMSGLLGYKSEDIYVFFNTEEKEISVYRIDKTEVKLSDIEKYFIDYKSNNDTVSLIYNIKGAWQDYTDINTEKDNLYVEYLTKGIRVEYNKYNKLFNVYSNSNIKLTSEDLKNYKFINVENKDLYYLAEITRNNVKQQALYIANDEMNEENRKLKTSSFCLYKQELGDGSYEAKIIPLNNNYMKSELRENISSAIWANDKILIYSVSGKGIYIYDAVNGRYKTLKVGNATFQLSEYKDGVVYYDETSINIK